MTDQPISDFDALPDALSSLGWPIVDRVLAQRTTSADDRVIAAWGVQHPALYQELLSVRNVFSVDRTTIHMPAADLERRIRSARAPQLQTSPRHDSRKTKQSRFRQWSAPPAIGAICAAMVIAVAIVRYDGFSFAGFDRNTVRTPVRTYTTASGQRATITLADGTVATLGPATTLSVVMSRSGGGTDATVVGEALFSVTHRAKSPFTVHAGTAVARVLGTKFMVRRYAIERSARIVVADGRVGVRNTAHGNAVETVLNARMLGVADDSGIVHVTHDVSVDSSLAWTSGVLVFDKASVRDVMLELGRAYNVKFAVDDSTLAGQALTWTVPTSDATLGTALNELSYLLSVRFIRSGQTIKVVRHNVARPVPQHHLNTPEIQYGR